MANPTTYFGWVMPTSTDLVTDLPADFNVFGQGVDTSMQDLLGGTTGQVLSKTSNTNMDFTWVTPTDQTPLTTKGDIFAFSTVDARLPAGTNETRLVADSTETLGLKYVADTTNYAIAAKADLLVGTAADTLAALTVGTNGQVLTADSTVSPTGLKWATPASGSAMTLISTTSFSGATTANIDGIFSSTYTKYKVILTRWTAGAGNDVYLKLRYGSTTESNANYYTTSTGINNGGTTTTLTESGGTKARIGTESQTGGGLLELTFVDVGTSAIQPFYSGIWTGVSTYTQLAGGTKNGTQQTYTGLQFLSSTGNVSGTISVYGLAS